MNGEKHRKHLTGGAVQIGTHDLFKQNLIALSEQVQTLFGDVTNDANRKAWSGEWVTPNDLIWNPQDFTKLPNLVFEEIPKRLNQFKSKILRKPPHIVVQLDVGGGARMAMS